MSIRKPVRAAVTAALALAAVVAGTVAYAATDGHRPPAEGPWQLVDRSPELVQPKALTVDRSIGEKRAAQEVRLAQLLYTFWNTGQQKYLDAAIGPDFTDNTLPAGRPQGPAGPVFASKNFRAAVPDLTCELSDLLVTGDKITARLVFRGHFTGVFGGAVGHGQAVEFNAIDIQHAGTAKIVEDWHIEDNQTLLGQLGVAG
ncbi:ester cyclase [Amycolatopsis cynarae]|uniref:Ester cyclase n=1 Tax=Amycolatopsis cynarae TaxID=2995223 RepID=A0ABY7B957_9PSEU|nr:ester cyclase [Amycolatopsis sp. HUAS 11-8]WAL68474.1 ester cyclase [Amycolatopsis sp. HUAS 11-8]